MYFSEAKKYDTLEDLCKDWKPYSGTPRRGLRACGETYRYANEAIRWIRKEMGASPFEWGYYDRSVVMLQAALQQREDHNKLLTRPYSTEELEHYLDKVNSDYFETWGVDSPILPSATAPFSPEADGTHWILDNPGIFATTVQGAIFTPKVEIHSSRLREALENWGSFQGFSPEAAPLQEVLQKFWDLVYEPSTRICGRRFDFPEDVPEFDIPQMEQFCSAILVSYCTF